MASMATSITGHTNWRRPVSTPIRARMSKPEFLDKPSLLTTIPAEIRNAIYSYLFLRENGIVYSVRSTHSLLKTKLSQPDNDDLAETQDTSGYQCPYPFFHDLDQAIPLLQTCSQIYHEAVSVLYKSNAFIIIESHHDHMATLDHFTNLEWFIQNLGSQSKVISNICVELGPRCVKPCEYFLRPGEMDIFPIIRTLWAQPDLTEKITFISSLREGYLDGRVRVPRFARLVNPVVLERLVKLIGIDDGLDLKKYAHLERLIRRILVHKSLHFGCVVYKGPGPGHDPDYNDDVEVFFDITHDDNEVELGRSERDWPPSFNEILRHCSKFLYNCSTGQPNEVVFDLTFGKATGFDTSLLHLNRDMRRYMQKEFAFHNQITIRLRTRETHTSFSGWRTLHSWSQNCISKVYPIHQSYRHYKRFSIPIQPVIELNFLVDDLVALKDIRISLTDFVQHTHHLYAHSVVCFKLKTRRFNLPCKAEHRILLKDLRRRYFLLLSQLLDCDKILAEEDLPPIWVDGLGEVLYATVAPWTAHLQNKHSHLDKDGIQAIGKSYISKLEHRVASGTRPRLAAPNANRLDVLYNTVNHGTHVSDLWLSLRDHDWCEPTNDK